MLSRRVSLKFLMEAAAKVTVSKLSMFEDFALCSD